MWRKNETLKVVHKFMYFYSFKNALYAVMPYEIEKAKCDWKEEKHRELHKVSESIFKFIMKYLYPNGMGKEEGKMLQIVGYLFQLHCFALLFSLLLFVLIYSWSRGAFNRPCKFCYIPSRIFHSKHHANSYQSVVPSLMSARRSEDRNNNNNK